MQAQLPDENIYYKINPTHSKHFLSVSANMFQNGTQIIQWENPPGTCEDGQAFKFEKVNGFYKITARNKYGKCLTVRENKQGSIVIIDDFRNTDNQLWKVEDLGGIYSIISKQNNYSINISGGNPNNGADVIVWPFTASSNDRFRLIPAEDETPYWENLGPEVNTSQSDYAPCFSPDGKTLFFSRGDTKGRYIYNSKVFMATQKPDGTFGNVKRMPEFDFEGNGRVVSFLPGGNQIVIFGDFTGGDDMFSIVDKTETGWSKPKPMGIKKPNIKYNTWTGFLAADGRTFIIEMNLTDRNDESDMYVSFQDDEGKWSTPKYMGDVINKPYIWDGTPYLSPDMTTLYFNSNRKGNSGTEIYMSKRLDDTWINWTEPVEINKGVYIYSVIQNYSVPGNGEYAYFVSGMKTFGEGDIFRMKIENKLKPEPFMIINGKALNSKDNSPVQSDIIFENLETGKRVGRLTSNPLTGEYQLALPKGKNYGIFASAEGYFSISENLDLKSLSEFETIEKNLLLTPVNKGETIRINNVFFDFAKATLQPESYPELDRVVEMLKLNNNFKIEIRGHTDNVGGEANNQTLSENRAQSVRNYIISKGINDSRVTSIGFGESKPVSANSSEKGRQENRRVEFKVL
jgi:outer membrane protein OmpA-like peptidoglycan-associated protein